MSVFGMVVERHMKLRAAGGSRAMLPRNSVPLLVEP
jgi:hypothetical protein